MNLKAKPIFQKEDGIYKIVDDFRKLRLFEVDCAASCSHFKTSLGNVRQNWVGNLRIARALNGALVQSKDLTDSFLVQAMNFDDWVHKLSGQDDLVASHAQDTFSINKGFESKTLISQAAIQTSDRKKFPASEATTPMQALEKNQLLAGFTGSKSLHSSPAGAAHNNANYGFVRLESLRSLGETDTADLGSCSNLEMVTCEDYPRELQVHNFALFNALRYSCGWRLAAPASGHTITYVYDIFDVHMVYELSLFEKTASQSDDQLEGIYTVTLLMPVHTKDLKKQIYDTVKREARVWDDILHLCHLMIAQFNSDWLKEYLKSHRHLVVDEFVHYLNDQKSVKIFERKSFGVLRCDSQIVGDKTDSFLRLVRSSFLPTFQLGLTSSAIIGVVEGRLVAAVLHQKSRNFMVCTLHILGEDSGQLEAIFHQIQANISQSGLKVCSKEIERFFSPFSQPMFRNPYFWDYQQWSYSKDIPSGLFNKSVTHLILKEILDLQFTMLTSLKKPGQSQTSKLSVFFIKEKLAVENPSIRYYLLVEVVFGGKENDGGRQTSKEGQTLEAIKAGILASDMQLVLDKTLDVKDEELAVICKSLDASVDKYSEVLHLYHLNIEAIKQYLDLCSLNKVKTINFKLRVPFQVFQQRQKKFEKSKLDDDFSIEIHEFQRYLSELLSTKEKKKAAEKKNVRIDLLSMCHPVYSYKLDFVIENTIKQDFLMAYEALLSEYCDCSFKIKAQTVQEKHTQYHSKFLKEHLLTIMYIDRSSPDSDYMLRVYLLCLKCVAAGVPYAQCEYLNHKSIWINKMYGQLQNLMQKYFLCNLSMKLHNNFRFYGNDIDQLTTYCDKMNIDIDISSLYRKLRSFFRADGKLSRKFLTRMSKIFRSVLKLFLTRVNHSTSWYFIYKHPQGEECRLDPDFAIRDKTLKPLMKASSLNNSIWNENSFLMMRLGYTNTNRCRFQCENKRFLEQIIAQCYLDAFSGEKKRDRVCSRLLLMNYTPLGHKELVQANSSEYELAEETPYIKEVAQFEENCHHTFNQIKQAMSETNIITIVRSFFNFLCLEVQMMDVTQPEEKISEMIRIDLQHFNEEEKISFNLPHFGPKSAMASVFVQTLIDKGYFKLVTLQAKKEEQSRQSLYCTFTYAEIDLEMSRLKPLSLKSMAQTSQLSPTFETNSMESSSDEDPEDNFDNDGLRCDEYLVDDDQLTPDMVAIILQLEIAPDLESYTLRYYFSLATTHSKMTEVLQKVKERVKECLFITSRSEVIKHIRQHGMLPKRVHLQSPEDFREDKFDFDEEFMPPRRKFSENQSYTSHSDMVTGHRERPVDRKNTSTDVCILEVMSKKEFEFPELITDKDSQKTSIFFLVRTELVQRVTNITYLPHLSSKDEFYFLQNNQILVRMSCSTIEKEPMKLIDPKSSFNEATLGSSIVEQPKKVSLATQRNEKIVTKMITVSVYATELKGGESEIIYTLTNSLIEKNVLENFRRFTRRMAVMRADSALAKYFLSEEPREFKFQYPKVNDKATFLLILKNNLHLSMSKVTGSLDHLPGKMTFGPRGESSSHFGYKAEPKDAKESAPENRPGYFEPLQTKSFCTMTPSCTDSVFFFNYNETNSNLFGSVLFFLNIADQDYNFPYYSEFHSNDGLYSCLVKRNDEGYLEFDSLRLEDNRIHPRLDVINGIKHVRHAKDSPPIKGVDTLTFNVSSRGQLRPDGLIEALSKAITNSVIELAIEQWLHPLYFKPGLNWKVEKYEAEMVHHLKTLQLCGLNPPSAVSKSVSHKIQSMNYFKLFISSLMRSCQRELSALFKNKDSLESIYYFQSPDEDDNHFESLEAMEIYLSEKYNLHEPRNPVSGSDSEDNSMDESEHTNQAQSPTPPFQVGDRTLSLNASKLGERKLKKLVNYGFDITKTKVQKNEAFVLVMRLRSPPVSDSLPFEQYSKINAHQTEPKVAHSELGEELKLQFPIRRCLISVEVLQTHINLLCYNIKEDITSKLLECLIEEITFHELRETLILGLSSEKVMNAVVSCDTGEFEARLCERYELTQIDNQKKLNEREIGLRVTWDYRFGDKDPNRTKARVEQSTITERVYEIIRKTSNGLMLPDAKICIAERQKTKMLIDAVYATISSTKLKVKTENLEMKFLQNPSFFKGSWFLYHFKDGSASGSRSCSKERSAKGDSQASVIDAAKPSLYLTVPRRSMDDYSELSVSIKSKRPNLQKSSSQSPSMPALRLSHRNIKKDLLIELPVSGNFTDDLPSPSILDEPRALKKTKTEFYMPSNQSMQSSYEDFNPTLEVPIDSFTEQAIGNLAQLQKNFATHLFDSKIRQLFALPNDQRMEQFHDLKHQRSLC